jgi:hypothetical protein
MKRAGKFVSIVIVCLYCDLLAGMVDASCAGQCGYPHRCCSGIQERF